jgi:hypothetical protein
MVNTVRRHMRAPLLHTTCELGLSQSMEAVGARYGGGSLDFGLLQCAGPSAFYGCLRAPPRGLANGLRLAPIVFFFCL